MPTSTSTTRTCRFGPLTIDYDARVLTPRPWTFAQSAWAAELASDRDGAAALLELCAGAGQIGLAAAVLADRDLVQVELDPVAAGYAVGNAHRAGWAARTEVRTGPLQTSLRAGESFSIIVADPPYLTSSGTARWPEDPVLAIDGGPDGLELIRACLRLAAEHLTSDGCLLLQVAGAAQAAEVEGILQANPAWQLRPRELRTIDAERAVLLLVRS